MAKINLFERLSASYEDMILCNIFNALKRYTFDT